jgi:eukaryotic-like serine/threonine-protein kinase
MLKHGWFIAVLLVAAGVAAIIVHDTVENPVKPAVKVHPPATASIPGGDWPSFRGGPAMLGIAAGSLPDQFALRWQFKTKGAVESSPVIAEGRVFIGSNDGRVYALDVKTGRRLWDFKTPEDDAVLAPPLYHGGVVYIGATDGWLYALDARTGEAKWKYQTDDKIIGAANVIPATNGSGDWIIVGSYDGALHCVDAGTGKKVWTLETGNYINGAPAVLDGQVIFGGCDALMHVADAVNGTLVKTIQLPAYIPGTAAVDDGRAYVGHYEKEFVCVDLEKDQIAWTYKDEEHAAPFLSSPALTADRVVFGGQDKRLHCADRKTGERLWVFQTGGDVDGSPVVCGDKVVVGSADGKLYIVNLADGKEVWSYEIGGRLTSSPAVGGGLVVIGSQDGSVYAFGSKP